MDLSTTRMPSIVPDRAKIKLRGMNTVVHPFDPVDNNASVWFPVAIGKSTVRTPNEVVPYIDGHPAFKDIVAAIRTAKHLGHFIYLLGWELDIGEDFLLDPTDKYSSIASLFTTASAKNVDIRVMLYHQMSNLSSEFGKSGIATPDNTPAIKFINELFMGKAIHDRRVVKGGILVHVAPLLQGLKVPYSGMHHQKVLIVNGEFGLIAFQGGMDLAMDRLYVGGAPIGLHDVHTRLRGRAAGSLWELFVDRWTDHPQSKNFIPIPTDLVDVAKATDDLQVEIGRTFPNSTKHTLFGPEGGRPYDFGALGDQSAKALVLNAIAQSKEFIYIEDQYLFDMSISDALKAALPHLKKLIILIVDSTQIPDQKQPFRRRKAFIENLTGDKQPPTSKVIVCKNRLDKPELPYVHSKTFIFDDKFAIIGSANLTRRGYSHDSEQNAGIFDPNTKKRFFFAHELRMNLWAKHLSSKRPIDFVDPIASSVHWSNPIGLIETYVLAGTDEHPGDPVSGLVWDIGIDPDGT